LRTEHRFAHPLRKVGSGFLLQRIVAHKRHTTIVVRVESVEVRRVRRLSVSQSIKLSGRRMWNPVSPGFSAFCLGKSNPVAGSERSTRLGRVLTLSKSSISFHHLSVFAITWGICSSLDGQPQQVFQIGFCYGFDTAKRQVDWLNSMPAPILSDGSQIVSDAPPFGEPQLSIVYESPYLHVQSKGSSSSLN
jgi:hypothetical protein